MSPRVSGKQFLTGWYLLASPVGFHPAALNLEILAKPWVKVRDVRVSVSLKVK